MLIFSVQGKIILETCKSHKTEYRHMVFESSGFDGVRLVKWKDLDFPRYVAHDFGSPRACAKAKKLLTSSYMSKRKEGAAILEASVRTTWKRPRP